MTIKNGDLPANPTIYADLAPNGQREIYCDQAGLTKREYFAALAMQGLLASLTADDNFSPAELARSAVLNTDALLAELERTK